MRNKTLLLSLIISAVSVPALGMDQKPLKKFEAPDYDYKHIPVSEEREILNLMSAFGNLDQYFKDNKEISDIIADIQSNDDSKALQGLRDFSKFYKIITNKFTKDQALQQFFTKHTRDCQDFFKFDTAQFEFIGNAVKKYLRQIIKDKYQKLSLTPIVKKTMLAMLKQLMNKYQDFFFVYDQKFLHTFEKALNNGYFPRNAVYASQLKNLSADYLEFLNNLKLQNLIIHIPEYKNGFTVFEPKAQFEGLVNHVRGLELIFEKGTLIENPDDVAEFVRQFNNLSVLRFRNYNNNLPVIGGVDVKDTVLSK